MAKTIPRYLLKRPDAERRALPIPQLREIHGLAAGGALSGVRVTPDTALTFVSVFSAVNRLATDVAGLPLGVYRRRADGGRDAAPEHPAHRLIYLSPDGETTASRFRQALMGHVLTWGNGYAEIVFRGGESESLHLLNPRDTRPERTPQSKQLYYRLDSGKTLPPYRVLHVAGLGFDGLQGYAPVAMARQAIGLGLAAEGFGAAFFGNGATPKGVLKTPQKLSETAVKNLRASIDAEHAGIDRAHRLMILEQGMEWQNISIPPEDAQFLATRQFQRTEIAALFSLPPHKIGDYSQSHLANIEESNLDYLMTSLGPWLRAIEQAMDMRLFTAADQAAGYYVKHNANALLRGNIAARTDHYVKGLNNGWLAVDEVRGLEDMNPLGAGAGGAAHFFPLNMQPLAAAVSAPAPAPAAARSLRFNPNHDADGKFTGGSGGGGGGDSGDGADADPGPGRRDYSALAGRVAAEGAAAGLDVQVEAGPPRDKPEQKFMEKAHAKGREAVVAKSAPKHAVEETEQSTTHRVGGEVVSEVFPAPDGSGWVARSRHFNAPDTPEQFKDTTVDEWTHKTRAAAEKSALSSAKGQVELHTHTENHAVKNLDKFDFLENSTPIAADKWASKFRVLTAPKDKAGARSMRPALAGALAAHRLNGRAHAHAHDAP